MCVVLRPVVLCCLSTALRRVGDTGSRYISGGETFFFFFFPSSSRVKPSQVRTVAYKQSSRTTFRLLARVHIYQVE